MIKVFIVCLLTSVFVANCAIVYLVETNLQEGATCTSSTNQKGICTKVENCVADRRSTVSQDNCFNEGRDKVVCCVSKKKNYTRTRPKETDKQNEFSNVVDNIAEGPTSKRLCQQKFEEYMNSINLGNVQEMNLLNGRELTAPGEYPHMTCVINIFAGFLITSFATFECWNKDNFFYIFFRKLQSAIGIIVAGFDIDWKCGGSLISNAFVLTAAHCTDFGGVSPNVVSIGDLNLKVREVSVVPQNFGVNRIVVHPSYRNGIYYNDIALLELSRKAVFTSFVRPACLWTKEDVPLQRLVAMGYGSTEFGKAQTNKLTELNLTVINNQKCDEQLPRTPKAKLGVINSQMCAIDLRGNSDTCQGDSGGPLQLTIRKNGRVENHLVGITSYGVNCGSQYPSVYTRIYSYLDWIERIVWS